MMKKVLAATGVLVVFVLYSIGVRHEQPSVQKPSTLATTNTNTAINTAPSKTCTNQGNSENEDDNAGSSLTTTCTNNTNTPTPSSSSTTGQYKDGTFKGSVADAYYGNVEVSATISGGKITDVTFLQYPNTHSDSVMINQQAMPYLKQEAIQAQNANVQIISGATFTSEAFVQSLSAALSQAKA